MSTNALIAAPGPGRTRLPIHTFGPNNEYVVKVAGDLRTRRLAYRLVYDEYLKEGYTRPHPEGIWVTVFDAHPGTVTVVVERDGEAVGTLTIVPDSPLGLPADAVYGGDLDRLRRSGTRLSEIISLAVSREETAGSQVVVTLCMFAYMVARRIHRSDAMVITINPRHARYYERRMHFAQIGEERAYGKVEGAPAVLLSCRLDTHLSVRGGDRERTIYRDWPGEEHLAELASLARRAHRPMSDKEFDYFIRKNRPVWERTTESEKCFLEDAVVIANLHSVPIQ